MYSLRLPLSIGDAATAGRRPNGDKEKNKAIRFKPRRVSRSHCVASATQCALSGAERGALGKRAGKRFSSIRAARTRAAGGRDEFARGKTDAGEASGPKSPRSAASRPEARNARRVGVPSPAPRSASAPATRAWVREGTPRSDAGRGSGTTKAPDTSVRHFTGNCEPLASREGVSSASRGARTLSRPLLPFLLAPSSFFRHPRSTPPLRLACPPRGCSRVWARSANRQGAASLEAVLRHCCRLGDGPTG